MKSLIPANVDDYISGFPENVQLMLKNIRRTIKKAAPRAVETIKYNMPTYVLYNNLVHFAAYKNHIGFYPVPSGIKAFEKELAEYKRAKGSAQFPLHKKIPLALIEKIVRFRVKENEEKEKLKTRRTCRKGHTFYKSSDCPTCPICEKEKKPTTGFLAALSAPARRALENNQITTLKALSKLSEAEVLSFHGLGKSSLPTLRAALAQEKMTFNPD